MQTAVTYKQFVSARGPFSGMLPEKLLRIFCNCPAEPQMKGSIQNFIWNFTINYCS